MTVRTIVIAAVFLSLFNLSCNDSGSVAGGNARLILAADPAQIGLGGTSMLTVTGTDENGVPLSDGTQVTFSVDVVGRVTPSSVQLVGGAATTTYFAAFAAGEITVTATSGSVQAKASITVADDIEQNVFVSANPSTFPAGGGTSVISAVVTDNSGRPVSNIGVRFSTTEGTLQSGGAPVQTNGSGVATDTLNTSRSASVTAETDDGFEGRTTVLVGVGRIVCHMTVSKDDPVVNENVTFFDTSDDPGNQIDSYQWNFGDGGLAQGRNPQHAYRSPGTFSVLHSVIDKQGNTIRCDPFPIVVTSP